MKILILTDIFGEKAIPSELLTKDSIILEPYEIDESIKDEKLLYNNFIKESGHENYFQLAYKRAVELDPDIIIGFSIGASIAWRLSSFNFSSKIICFYPSQIRNHLDIIPKVETTVVFPKKELHFNLDKIIEELRLKKNLELKKSIALHGFMNEKSINYDKSEKFKFVQMILQKFYE